MANMNFGVNILPKANNTYSLGNSDYKWNIYANTINGTNPGSYYIKPPGGIPSTDLADTYLTSHQDISGKADKANAVFTGSISLNRKEGTTVGDNSIAVGSSNRVEASGTRSAAFNSGIASGTGAFANGSGTASGTNSHAEGSNTTASGQASHVEGTAAQATGQSSHAEGASWVEGETDVSTTASGNASHAEGRGTTASGDSAHTWGKMTIAQKNNQTAFGKYNVADTGSGDDGSYAEIVGNGTADNARSNARTLDWNGNEHLKGDVYVNCNANSSGGTALGAAVGNLSNLTTTNKSSLVGATNELSSNMGKTNIHVDVSSKTYNSVDGVNALFNALPTQFKGTCYATFINGYNAVCLVDKHSATYGSIIYEVDWDTAPFYFVMKNGTASLDQLALNSKLTNLYDNKSWNDWTAISLQNCQAWNENRYIKIGNIVYVMLSVKSLTANTNTRIVADYTIPSGYRPIQKIEFAGFGGEAYLNMAHFTINTNGGILVCSADTYATGIISYPVSSN